MKSLSQRSIDYADYNYHESNQPVAETAYRDGYTEAYTNTTQRSIFWFCMGVVMTVLFCLVAGVSFKAHGQDSVQLKVTWSKRVGNTTHYIFKMPSGEKVKSTCECKELRRKGEIVIIAKKDIEFIKPIL